MFKYSGIVLRYRPICTGRRHYSKQRVRVRFAPSPTGSIHLGGLRTALYNDLFAKAHKGVTVLRIEDTDQSRKIEGAAQELIDDLSKCGISFDEGPYFQSDRLELYQQHVQMLLENGSAYHCFCSPLRLELLKKEAVKARQIPKYDNKCRNLSKEEAEHKLKHLGTSCIRFKLSNVITSYEDAIYGLINFGAELDGDPVILKTDGFPTYHLANVVDDHLMGITHVLRGVEWQVSTIKHLLFYKAFNWNPPVIGHLPLLLNSEGTKISKRQNDVRIRDLLEMGIFPNALLNHVTRAGGGFHIEPAKRDLKSFTMDEFVDKFDIKRICNHSCQIDLSKLEECNRREIKRLLEVDEKQLIRKVQEIVTKHFANSKTSTQLELSDEHVKNLLVWVKDRIYRLEELVSPDWMFIWVLPDYTTFDKISIADHQLLEKLKCDLTDIEWNMGQFKVYFKEFAKTNNLKFPQLMKTMRALLCGSEQGPSVVEMLNVLGREKILSRLTSAMQHVKSSETGKIARN